MSTNLEFINPFDDDAKALWAVEGTETADDENYRVKLLWAAVVRRAIIDWVIFRSSEDIRKKRIFRDAHEWLFVDDEHTFRSFQFCCSVLEMDPLRIREVVRGLTKAKIRFTRNISGW